MPVLTNSSAPTTPEAEALANRERVIWLHSEKHVLDNISPNAIIVGGGSGIDIFFATDEEEDFFGGGGSNSVLYTSALTGLLIDLADTSNSTGFATNDTFTDIKFLHGSHFDDTIIAGSGVTNLYGEGGDDLLIDAAGTQRLSGGAGSDTFRLIEADGAQDRILDFEIGTDVLDLSLWGLTSFDDPGLTIFEPTDGNGDGLGFLRLIFNGNQLRLDDLTESDIASFSDDDFVFAADAFAGAQIDGTAAGDVIDTTYVDPEGEQISGGGQTIFGLGGNDDIYDGAGDDAVYGGDGNDNFFGGAGADDYFGGAGTNSVYYTRSSVGLRIDLTDTNNSTGIAKGDTYTDIRFIFGSDFGDVFIADETVRRIYGGDGNDEITDGDGFQRLYGGDGIDTFIFVDGDGQRDRIMDFELTIDQLDLTQWGITTLEDPSLVIQEATNGQGDPLGYLTVSYNGNEFRIDGLIESDIAALITSDTGLA